MSLATRLATLQFQSNLGVAFTDALDINEVASWTIISGVCMTFPILLVILIVTVLPESPIYLVQAGR